MLESNLCEEIAGIFKEGFFTESAYDIIPSFNLALENIRIFKLDLPYKRVITRFYNFEPFTIIAEARSSKINKFIAIRGDFITKYI